MRNRKSSQNATVWLFQSKIESERDYTTQGHHGLELSMVVASADPLINRFHISRAMAVRDAESIGVVYTALASEF